MGAEGNRSFQPAMIHQERIFIEATRKTPFVLLEQGNIIIRGRAISENPGEFFRPLYDWITQYAGSTFPRTEMVLGFEYINTSSIKWVFAMLKEFGALKNSYAFIKVTWNYEKGDEDMCELGLFFKSFLDCSFSVIAVDKILNLTN